MKKIANSFRILPAVVLIAGTITIGAGGAAEAYTPCGASSYLNSSGTCVHDPESTVGGSAPSGATAQCGDGTYSFSQHTTGTCSRHGGVSHWLNQ